MKQGKNWQGDLRYTYSISDVETDRNFVLKKSFLIPLLSPLSWQQFENYLKTCTNNKCKKVCKFQFNRFSRSAAAP